MNIPEGPPPLEYHGGVRLAEFADLWIARKVGRAGVDRRVARTRPANEMALYFNLFLLISTLTSSAVPYIFPDSVIMQKRTLSLA